MSHVSFPGLGLEFDINRVAFTVGGFEIYWYGILIALGMFIGVILGQKNAKRFGIDEDKLYDVIIWGAIGAILGGRTFYVLFADDYEVKNIWQFLNLREGGTAFYGILTGALLTSFIVCKINKTRYRQPRSRFPGRPGHREVGQLLQPGALRNEHRSALGHVQRYYSEVHQQRGRETVQRARHRLDGRTRASHVPV